MRAGCLSEELCYYCFIIFDIISYGEVGHPEGGVDTIVGAVPVIEVDGLWCDGIFLLFFLEYGVFAIGLQPVAFIPYKHFSLAMWAEAYIFIFVVDDQCSCDGFATADGSDGNEELFFIFCSELCVFVQQDEAVLLELCGGVAIGISDLL